MAIERFIRFEDPKGTTLYGEPTATDVKGKLEGKTVTVLAGDPYTGFQITSEKAEIKQCIGLNYAHHAKEAGLQVPSNPVVFTKPADALAGPYDDIYIHPEAQSQLDYEGELSVIIGKDGKNLTEDNALDHVLGYTVGNDVSARNFQVPGSVSGNQFGYAKSFDRFAPIGPAVLLAKGVDPHALSYTTKVNGEKRQETKTDDMIWTLKKIIVHLSRGTTLRKGTVIMTGTPSGVGIFMEPKEFLKNGDVVEIEVDGIGAIANKMVFL